MSALLTLQVNLGSAEQTLFQGASRRKLLILKNHMFRIIELLALIILIGVVSYRFIIVPIYRYISRDRKQFKEEVKKIDEEDKQDKVDPTYYE